MNKFSPRNLIKHPGRLSYHDMILETSGLISYWNFGAGQGDKLWDQKGTNHGDITGATWTQKSNGIYTLDFDGNDNVNIPNLNIGTGSPFILSAWVKPSFSGTYRSIMGYDARHRLLISVTGAMLSQQEANFGSLAGSVPNGQWTYVIYWNDGTKERWYINGVQSGADHSISSAEWDLAFYIGQYNLISYKYYGCINEVAIYNVALTPAQIKRHYDVGIWEGLAE